MKKSKILLSALAILIFATTKVDALTQDGWYKNGENWELYQNHQLVRNTWKYVQQQWYHFDENGKMQTGWIKENNNWYYLAVDGALQTDWYVAKDSTGFHWYYANSDGVMQTGWIKDKTNKWYSLSSDGSMRIKWYQEAGKWYFLGYNGDMKTGWWKVDHYPEKWSYFNADGSMTADQAVPAADGELYMIGKDGYMVEGMSGREFYLDAHGDEYKIDGSKVFRGWYLQPNVTLGKVGYDLLFAAFDYQKPNQEIQPDKVVHNLQNFEKRYYFGSDGKRVKNLPIPITLHSEIEMHDGKPFLANPKPTLWVLGHFTINNGQLYLLKNPVTGELKSGYDIVYGSGPEAGYNLLIFADETGKILKMKRLSEKSEELPHKEVVAGLFNDKIYVDYDQAGNEVTVLK